MLGLFQTIATMKLYINVLVHLAYFLATEKRNKATSNEIDFCLG
jgi:hypothetical protein